MQSQIPFRDDYGLLATWDQLEKARAAARQAQQPAPVAASNATQPRLEPVPQLTQRPASKVHLTDSAPVALQSTSPVLISSGSDKAGGSARLSSSTSSLSLPDLPGDRLPAATRAGPRRSRTAAEPAESVREFRRKISGKLSELTSSLSDWARKASPRSERNSPEESPRGKRGSPSKEGSPKRSPRTRDTLDAVLTTAQRNRLATEMADYCLRSDYQAAGPARQSMLFTGKLGQLLEAEGVALNDKLADLLNADLQARMVNAAVDVHVDLQDPRYRTYINDAVAAQFMQNWRKDKAGEEAFEKYPAAKGVLTKTFLRDFGVTRHYLRHPDGRLETVRDPMQIAKFIGQGESGDLAERVSHVANQNLTIFLHRALFARSDAEGKRDSVIRLADGTPVTPRGAMEVTCTYARQADGTVVLQHEMHCVRKPNSAPLSVLKAGEAFGAKTVPDHAELHVFTQISFSPDGEWQIGDPHVRAAGWNQTVDE